MHGKSERTHLMSIVAGETAGGAYPGDSIGHAGETGEDGLALEVAAGVGALLAVVPAQHQISLLHSGFPPAEKAQERAEHDTKRTTPRMNRIQRGKKGGETGHGTSSSASMPSMYSLMVIVGSASSAKASPPSRAASAMSPTAAAGGRVRVWRGGQGTAGLACALARGGEIGEGMLVRGAEIEQKRKGITKREGGLMWREREEAEERGEREREWEEERERRDLFLGPGDRNLSASLRSGVGLGVWDAGPRRRRV